ncbi:MAG: AAA family ATPase [Eubacteriales bacterium]|nr:AAA family ATPase [Clostridiales bacterium]MDD6932803.1 AAA family ATPase [Eubacteriales bacterium]MDY2602586.1 AAA family ATPase [Eubacteriales bacterium]
MKRLIFVNGAMGAGKTTVCRELKEMLQPSVFLDGDWCWDMSPFVVTAETQQLVLDNICGMLNRFLACDAFENVIFCWVMHRQEIIDGILARLETGGAEYRLFTLDITEKALRERLGGDIAQGKRTPDVIARSMDRRLACQQTRGTKIDVSRISPREAAVRIARAVKGE